MQEDPIDRLIDRTWNGLRLRGRLAQVSEALLAGGCGAAVALAGSALGLLPVTAPLWTGALAAVVTALLRRPKRIDRISAALRLDLSCGLQERLCTLAGRRDAAPPVLALRAEVAPVLATIDLPAALGPLWPARAAWIALPAGVCAALLLLAPTGVAPHRTDAARPAKAAVERLAALRTAVAEAKARFDRTGAMADREALEQALAALAEETARRGLAFRPARSGGGKAGTAGGAGTEAGGAARTGPPIPLAGTETTPIALPASPSRATEPDWEAIRSLDDSFPVARRDGVRAYFRALASNPGGR